MWICQSLLVPCKCWPCAFNMLCLVLVKPMFWHYVGFLVGCCYWTEANHNGWKPVSWNTMWKEYVGCNWSFWVCIGGKCSFVDCCSYQFLQHRIGGPHTPGCPCTHGAGMFGKTHPSMHVSCWMLDLIFLHLGCSLEGCRQREKLWQSWWVWFRADNVWLYGVNITLHSFTCFIFIFWPCLETSCSSFVQCYKSNSTGAQYMTLQQIKIGWRKVKMCQFFSAKLFWPSILAQLVCWGW